MAEEGIPANPVGRQIMIIATVVTVVFFTLLLVGIRSCSAPAEKESAKPAPSTHTVIYSNLTLKDAALVITRLKELKIPYQIKDDGQAIAVPRNRADEARLGLAEKNLPAGGTVGWEIFDQSKLGATDFDRRIQFIRAVSGELSRTINRISVVEDARVQIVIPETKLFEVSTSPVTASVLLKLKPGETLLPKQVNGIIHLVAGSVENLKPENVTIIDINGNILSGAENIVTPKAEEVATPAAEIPQDEKEVVVQKAEGKDALDVQAKLDLEEKLTSKVQSLLNKFYPLNVTIARVNVDSLQTKKTTIIILVDKKFKISSALKKTTFETIAAAVGYDKTRGDRIVMKSVPFRSAGTVQSSSNVESKQSVFSLALIKQVYRKFGRVAAIVIIALFALFIVALLRVFSAGKKALLPEEEVVEEIKKEEEHEDEAGNEEVPMVEQMKMLASQKPDQVAELIRIWLAEEGA